MELFIRENYLKKIRGFYHEEDLIKVITGVRRCGKSSLMRIIADELFASDVKKENIIFIDLDADENIDITTPEDLREEIKVRTQEKGTNYLFIDEIQNVPGFEKVINGLRTSGGWSIFLTGSNSYLLSGEIATKLTGRYLEFELLPLSFEEYLQMKDFYGIDINPNLLVELNSYIFEGGFPRTVTMKNLGDKRKYVTELVREIFDKDIKRRVKIRDVAAFEVVRNYMIGNFGSTYSINGLCKAMKGAGIGISRATLGRYIKELVSARILYECDRFDLKSKRALSGEKKYYLSDLSFYYVLNTDNRINYGPVLENIVYTYARSKDYSISVGKIGKLECDFIMRDIESNYSYVQVAYTINESRATEDREYRPLEQIRDNYPKYVITTDYLMQKRNGINHENIMDFMKDGRLF